MNLYLLLISSFVCSTWTHPVWDVSLITSNTTQLDDGLEPMVEPEDGRGLAELVDSILSGKTSIKCATGQGQEGRCSVGRCANLANATGVSCPGRLASVLTCCPVEPAAEIAPDRIEGCGVRPTRTSNLIVGGTEAVPFSWPWAVALYRVSDNRRFFSCGGSIINRRYILTAAHCIKRPFQTLQAKDFLVKVGAHYLSTSGDFVELEQIVAHENYSPAYHNDDIALLKLKSPLNFSDSRVAPICLPEVDSSSEEGKIATMVGWGVHDQNDFASSPSLHEVHIPVSSKDQCRSAYTELMGSNAYFDWNNVLCASLDEGGKDTCQGDSGGPMAIADSNGIYSQAGVVSFGYGCAQKGYPGVYTHVAHYINWIGAHMTL